MLGQRIADAVKCMGQAGSADDVGRPARLLLVEKVGGRQRRGVKGRFVDRDPHLVDLVFQVARSPLAVVGQKEKLVPSRAEALDKIERTGNQSVAMIDHAVHVDHEADRHLFRSFIGQQFGICKRTWLAGLGSSGSTMSRPLRQKELESNHARSAIAFPPRERG